MGLFVSCLLADGSVASAKKTVSMIPLYCFSYDSPGKQRTSFKTHFHEGDMDRQDITRPLYRGGLSLTHFRRVARLVPEPNKLRGYRGPPAVLVRCELMCHVANTILDKSACRLSTFALPLLLIKALLPFPSASRVSFVFFTQFSCYVSLIP
ncbi:hypothetical protein CDEST_08479 [Colletotrichum destructivum]|uniref:Secreted protein n=1 Tax=Colletotrichum destructivum TaxID=34406 RepID=A0AAX4IJD4_9PEZI|nr:hypothetical protein CDEST_08479 [Colletotrichum destructivum]